MATEEAELAARHARRELEIGQTKNGAWFALWAVQLDDQAGLAWALLARIVLEATEDPLGTICTRHALEVGVPDPERSQVERHHRIDLWTRGLLDHHEGAAILKLEAFDHSEDFTPSPRFDRWLLEQTGDFGDGPGVAQAVARMVAAFSDAWTVPETDDNPLRAEGWTPTEAWNDWLASDPLAEVVAVDPPAEESAETKDNVRLLSDYRIEQQILELGAQGSFQLARDRALLWTQLRDGRVKPLAMLIRVLHAGDWKDERDEAVRKIVALDSRDLNELEDARVTLGELELWTSQLGILDQMAKLAPDHPVILANRGVARMQVGATEDGARDLEGALAVDPDCGPALANLGLHRMREDEYVAARTLLERAVTVAPNQAQVRVYLAACKNNQGERAGAIEELEKALAIEPEHTQATQLLAELRARGPVS